MRCFVRLDRKKGSFPFFFAAILFALSILIPITTYGTTPNTDANQAEPDEDRRPERFQIVFEPDAYYTALDFIFALTKEPIPRLRPEKESEIYNYLLKRSLVPRFLVLEASVYPMPYLGVYVRKHYPDLYADAQVSESFNWITALTAGFQEPYAASVLVGNVVDFDVPDRKFVTGKGYSGYLVSAGNYHIKDNVNVKDDWREFEWKVKGDRESPERKLSWSFRIGAKLHGNPDITDVVYFSIRRSRTDFKTARSAFYHNSGFEYTFDMNRRGFDAVRHYLTVEKKWPLRNKKIALALAVGFVWEAEDKYTGALGADRTGDTLEFIVRPNIEF